eukprot:6173752-Pleurochrysis_carterae.AAC.1
MKENKPWRHAQVARMPKPTIFGTLLDDWATAGICPALCYVLVVELKTPEYSRKRTFQCLEASCGSFT